MRDENSSVGFSELLITGRAQQSPWKHGGFCKLADHWEGSRVVKVVLFRLFCLEKQVLDLFSEKEQKSAAVAEGVGLCTSVNGLLNTKKLHCL